MAEYPSPAARSRKEPPVTNGPAPPAAPGDGLSFEEAYTRLEQTVQRLETGGLSLDEALALYEEGMRLAGVCARLLDAAELRITQVSAAPDGEMPGP
jgi:exodeoxyribonuclease VII small subunit